MRYTFYNLILLLCMAAPLQAQPVFRNIDTLLTKNAEALNLKSQDYYISLLNLPKLIPAKGVRSRRDTLSVLKPFTDAFADMLHELREFAGSDDPEIRYDSYTSSNTACYDANTTGKLLLQVSFLINNTFTVKVPFFIVADKGRFTIEQPMNVMFVE